MLKLSLTLEERVIALISRHGMTFGDLCELFPETEQMALQKCVRALVRTGVITMEPQLLMSATHLNANTLTPLDIADDVYSAIPLSGITWGDLKQIFLKEMRYGDLLMKLFLLNAGNLIQTSPEGGLRDSSVIEKVRNDDKVVAFISRRKTA